MPPPNFHRMQEELEEVDTMLDTYVEMDVEVDLNQHAFCGGSINFSKVVEEALVGFPNPLLDTMLDMFDTMLR